jgi:hypothetical protein
MHAWDDGLTKSNDEGEVQRRSKDGAVWQAECIVGRADDGGPGGRGSCREMPDGGLQSVLEDKSGDAGTKARVGCRRGLLQPCGRGACLFPVSSPHPSLSARAGLCSAHPGRHQAKRHQNATTTLA